MDYYNLSKETIAHLYKAHDSFDNSSLPKELRLLLEIRVSQINNCSYCINLHKSEAIKFGMDKDKIESLENFSKSNNFTDVEKEALIWAENITKLQNNIKVQDSKLKQYFNEREIADITICISLMNAFNRIAITMR